MESTIRLFVGIALLQLLGVDGCNVCRNGGRVLNPNYEFVMEDVTTNTRYQWSCGFLEEAFADVNEINGAAGEARYCALGQLWADRECECSGDPVPPPNNVIDPNPACNLCGRVDGIQRDLNYVPEIMVNELIETGYAGRMPCGGLYNALSQGILPSSACTIVQRNAGGSCCAIPSVEPPAISAPEPEPEPELEPACAGIGEECESQACCSQYQCRTRGIGVPQVCSARPRTFRQSVARPGSGGAAGTAKNANN